MRSWLSEIESGLLRFYIRPSRTARDAVDILDAYVKRLQSDPELQSITLGQFAGDGKRNDRLNLSTLHSAKGREFRAVVLFGMDDGRIPRRGASGSGLGESRRTFYVGFTRAKRELHIVYTESCPSPFVIEVQRRIEAEA